ncbi:MAG: carboxypeptidase regulatory-like domain-containing protein, partial [Thermoplasmata archaeon]
MKKNMWKNRFLVSLMVLVLIGALFIPTSTGAEEARGMRATSPDMEVSVAVNESADMLYGTYANITHNFTVTVKNTGSEVITNITVGLIIYNKSANAVELDMGNQTITTLGVGETAMVYYLDWDPKEEGDYAVAVTAMADTYPVNDKPNRIYEDENTDPALNMTITIYEGGTVNVKAVGAYLSDSDLVEPDFYLDVTRETKYYINASLYVTVVVENIGNGPLPANGIDIDAKIYYTPEVGEELAYDESVTIDFESAVGNFTKFRFPVWGDVDGNTDLNAARRLMSNYRLEIEITTADMYVSDNFFNLTFNLTDAAGITDVMPVKVNLPIIAGGLPLNTSALQPVPCLIKNSGTAALTEDFFVNITIRGPSAYKDIKMQNVDYTLLENPGEDEQLMFMLDTSVLAEGSYTINLTTSYARTVTDFNASNNYTGPIFPFKVIDSEEFDMAFVTPMTKDEQAKQELEDIEVNVSIMNTGTMHTHDYGGVNLNISIFDKSDWNTPVVFDVQTDIILDSGEMVYKTYDWLMAKMTPGMTYSLNATLYNATMDLAKARSINITFPSDVGSAFVTVDPTTNVEGATVTIGTGTGTLTSSGNVVVTGIAPGTHDATVTGMYYYEDATEPGVVIMREIRTDVNIALTAKTTYALNGTIYDQDMNSVSGAAVKVVATGVFVPSTTSAATTGYYEFASVVPDETTTKVTLNVSKTGYYPTEVTFNVTEDTTMNVTINLIPAPVDVKVDVPARAMTTIPDEGLTGVSIATDVYFDFDFDINTSMVEDDNVFTIKQGTTAVDGEWNFTDGDDDNSTFFFDINDSVPLDYVTTYDIMIGSTLENLTGAEWYFGMDKVLNFTTEELGTVEVKGKVVDSVTGDGVEGTTVTVSGGTTETATTNANGEFTFAAVELQEDTDTPYTFTAAATKFYNNVRYAGGTADLLVNKSIALADGLEISVVEQDLPVELDKPAVAINVSHDTTIEFTFVDLMNFTEVESAFSLKTGGVTATGEMTTADNKTYTFTPDANLTYGAMYDIKILKSVENADGNLTLWKDFESNFTVKAAPPEISAKIMVGTTELPSTAKFALDSVISIEFTATPYGILNTTITTTTVTITPGITISAFIWDGDKVTLTTSALTCGTTYTIALTDGITDTMGNKLTAMS